ncbi:DUF4360 domain-containing protein [Actinoplanes sp. NPDC049599]|uniref:DUF4360 domain-containing protein n=1 Tax=Actinoplanes sp. NPDC049599 TaxID=3363903 RepID=UPI00379E5D3A
MRTITAGAALLAALAVPSPALARPSVPLPPDQIMIIDVVNANGSGCPLGTTAVAVSPDNTAFTITYSEYTAMVGPEAGALDFRKNCQLALDIKVPSGFTFAIASADYRGFAKLAAGATALEAANYYFQGNSQTVRLKHHFRGPMDSDWQKTDTVGIASLSFLPCGERRYLNINTELRVSGGWSDTSTKTSIISMDSTDAAINTIYRVAWKRCR